MKANYAPMLAAKLDIDSLRFPVYASPKLDGVRCVVAKGRPLSRKLKVIPNKHVQALFAQAAKEKMIEGLDGELIVGDPFGEGVFARTTSGVMSHCGSPMFTYWVFDTQGRDHYVHRQPRGSSVKWIKVLPQTKVDNEIELFTLEKKFLAAGYEGLIGRSPYGLYKHGRATMKEGLLWKLVRFATEEATVVDFEELEHNDNVAEKDNLGHTKRSTRKDGKRAAGVLGAFICESENYRDIFKVGTGFTQQQRVDFWNSRRRIKGKLIRFKYKPFGQVDKPRHPVFQGFRDKRDT